MEDIKRIFFHELGHFVANQINKLHLGGSGTEKISLYPCEKDPQVFCGGTTPVLPEGKTRTTPPPKDRLAQRLLSTLYGCIFQAYERKTTLRECLDTHGCHDVQAWSGFLYYHQISWGSADFATLDEQYFNKIVSANALDEFLSIDPSKYLLEESKNRYTINLEALEKATAEMVKKHTHFYLEHVQRYQSLIAELRPFDPSTGKFAD